MQPVNGQGQSLSLPGEFRYSFHNRQGSRRVATMTLQKPHVPARSAGGAAGVEGGGAHRSGPRCRGPDGHASAPPVPFCSHPTRGSGRSSSDVVSPGRQEARELFGCFFRRGMCDLNNVGPCVPWIPRRRVAFDRGSREPQIGRGAPGEGRLLVATPRSPSRLILEPGMPQTERHLPNASRKEGCVVPPHPADSRWGRGPQPAPRGSSHLPRSPVLP